MDKVLRKSILQFLTATLFLIISIAYLGGEPSVAANPNSLRYEQIREYDVKLFNEWNVRDQAWPVYGYTFSRRKSLVRKMAEDEEFPVGRLALKLWNFNPNTPTRSDMRVFSELDELAAKGDPSAMCMLAHIREVSKAKTGILNLYKYAIKASKMGHPACTYKLAIIMEPGRVEVEGVDETPVELITRSALAGYQKASKTLFWRYLNGKDGYKKDLSKAFCWYMVGRQANTGLMLSYVYFLQRALDAANEDMLEVPTRESGCLKGPIIPKIDARKMLKPNNLERSL